MSSELSTRVLAIFLAVALMASAQDTDYVFRGVSQTDENPEIFGGVDATIGSIGYAGVWLSNVGAASSQSRLTWQSRASCAICLRGCWAKVTCRSSWRKFSRLR